MLFAISSIQRMDASRGKSLLPLPFFAPSLTRHLQGMVWYGIPIQVKQVTNMESLLHHSYGCKQTIII
jgi:hypothetical protein